MKNIHILKGHKDRIWSVAVHPKSKLIATSSADKTAKIWNIRSSSATNSVNVSDIATLEDSHQKSVRSVAWKPIGPPCLALGSFDATVSIWGLEGGGSNEEDEPEWTFLASIEGHENEVKSVSWSSDGIFLASCSRDKSIWIWETDEMNEEFECVSVLQEHSQDVKHVNWHSQENVLASTSYDDTVRLWREDEDDWICVAELEGHKSTVWCSDFEKNSSSSPMRLVSCSGDGTCIVWVRTDEEKSSVESRRFAAFKDTSHEQWAIQSVLPKTHEGDIYAVAWSAGTKNRIISAGSDGRIVVYKEGPESQWTVEHVQEQAHGVHEINCVAWIDDETIISGGDDCVARVWTL